MQTPRLVFRFLFHALLALLSFALVSGWIRSGVPWPESYGLRAKMQAFAGNKDAYATVYVGSSRTFRAFRPEVIDRESSDGSPDASFNLGLAGASSWEVDAFLREVLAMNPARLRRVVVEMPDWTVHLPREANRHTARRVYWHTPSQTFAMLGSAFRAERPLPEKLALGRFHLSLMARHLSNYALGPLWWQARLGPDPATATAATRFAARGGYEPLEEAEDPEIRRRRAVFLDHQDAYLRAVASLAREEARDPAPGFDPRAQQRQERLLHDSGLEAYYVLPPGLAGCRGVSALERPALMNYCRPDRHPELFRPESRFDADHLSEEGARRFSRIFAADLAARARAMER